MFWVLTQSLLGKYEAEFTDSSDIYNKNFLSKATYLTISRSFINYLNDIWQCDIVTLSQDTKITPCYEYYMVHSLLLQLPHIFLRLLA